MRHLIIGLGSMGKRHLHNLRRLRPNDTFITVDTDLSRGADYQYPSAELVRDSLVYICSPTQWHSIHATFASQYNPAGIFIEKPLFPSVVYGQKVNWPDCPIAVGYMYRFHDLFRELKSHTHNIFSFHVYASDASLRRYEQPALELLLAHPINTAQWLFGDMKEHTTTNQGERASFVAKSHSGVSISMSADMLSEQRISLCIVGWLNYETRVHEQRIFNVLPDEDMYVRETEAWLKYVETGESGDLCTLGGALGTQELLR